MMRRVAGTIVGLTLAVAMGGCANEAPQPDDASGWEVERSTEDGVTTVRNLAGSKWGGAAKLERVASIGVAEGAPQEMLAGPRDTWITEDEIFVADRTANTILVYDLQGGFRRQFGREGVGPGELQWPSALAVWGDHLVVSNLRGEGRVSVYTLDGEHVANRRLPSIAARLFPLGDGRLFFSASIPSDDPRWAFRRAQAYQQLSEEGPVGSPAEVPLLGEGTWIEMTMQGRTVPAPVPMTPTEGTVWTIGADARLVLGYPGVYEFEIRSLDGGATTRVERAWEPVRVEPAEAEDARDLLVNTVRRFDPEFVWDGAEIPSHKPAYERIRIHADGRIWVLRAGPGRRRPDCDAPQDGRPCWESATIVDVFDTDGSYLGQVVGPEGEGVWPSHARGDLVSEIEEDAAGTYRVHLYRLVLPDNHP